MSRRQLSLLAGALLAGMPGAIPIAAGAISGEATVTIDNFSYTPAELTVPVGTKVTWTNRDDIPHTVTGAAETRDFKSPALDTGDVFAHVFSAAGTYHYFCSLHPHMQGTVVVQ